MRFSSGLLRVKQYFDDYFIALEFGVRRPKCGVSNSHWEVIS